MNQTQTQQRFAMRAVATACILVAMCLVACADQRPNSNLVETEPEVAANLERQLEDWQRSVLKSLTGADYR